MIFICSNETGDISQDASSTFNDGESVGLTSVRQCTNEESKRPIDSTDVSLVLSTMGRQIPKGTQDTLQSGLLKGMKNYVKEQEQWGKYITGQNLGPFTRMNDLMSK